MMTTSALRYGSIVSDASADSAEPPQAEWPAGTFHLEIQTSSRVTRQIDTAWIYERLSAAARAISAQVNRPAAAIDVRIVSDAEMAELHQIHKGLDGPTDVLSFDLADGAASPIEADIVVCADVASRRAAEFGHSVERELLLYAIHGLLHCAGFNDLTDADYQRMHAAEDRILKEIGVGATFHSSSENSLEGAP